MTTDSHTFYVDVCDLSVECIIQYNRSSFDIKTRRSILLKLDLDDINNLEI